VRQTRGATWAIVLAAGGGHRFGGEKQFDRAGGVRLVDLAVSAAARACDNVVLVLPPGRSWDGDDVHTVVAGGRDRAASVREGLASIPASSGTVVVHQAANPLASVALFSSLLDAIDRGADAAAPGLRPADLVRRTSGDSLGEVVGRDDLVLVQTPAAFQLAVLRAAHDQPFAALEDTALVSSAGYEVTLVPGDPRNIHVTTPADLQIVGALLRANRG
jgi:2-C-methyl-D-erythritol 4-phosphate cytidylyltransferase